MGFSRQEYWSGLPFPSPEDLPDPGIKPRSPALQADALASDPPQNPGRHQYSTFYCCIISTLWIPSFYQSVYQLMNIWVISIFWLLGICYRERACTSLCRGVSSVLLETPRVEFLVIWLAHVPPFEELPECFPKWLHHFAFLLVVCKGSDFTDSYYDLFDYSWPMGGASLAAQW